MKKQKIVQLLDQLRQVLPTHYIAATMEHLPKGYPRSRVRDAYAGRLESTAYMLEVLQAAQKCAEEITEAQRLKARVIIRKQKRIIASS